MALSLYAIALNKVFDVFGNSIKDKKNPEIQKLRIIMNSNYKRLIHYRDEDCCNQLHSKMGNSHEILEVIDNDETIFEIGIQSPYISWIKRLPPNDCIKYEIGIRM